MLDLIKAKLQGALKSSTVYFNSVAGSVLIALPMLQDNLPQLQDYLPHGFYKYMMGVVIFSNIALRFKTKKDLVDK